MVDTDSLEHAPADLAAIDGPKALELLRVAVATRGAHYIYESPTQRCMYEEAGVPSCIVGVALSLHGVPIDLLVEWDTYAGGTESIETYKGKYDWLTDAAVDVFQSAQSVQDRATWVAQDIAYEQCTWGNALAAAEQALAGASS